MPSMIPRTIAKELLTLTAEYPVVTILGPRQAGKTTLASLVPRFFDPWEGQVLFDGTDACEFRLYSLRQQVSLVLQEPFLLPLTVAENIAYGRPHASSEEIVAASVAANISAASSESSLASTLLTVCLATLSPPSPPSLPV